MTQDAMRMAILKTRKYAGKICIHEVSDEDAQIIWKAAHQSREAEVQRLREALEEGGLWIRSLREGLQSWRGDIPLGLACGLDSRLQTLESWHRQAITPAKESDDAN